jgi:S-adenosylmethionine hydrolase
VTVAPPVVTFLTDYGLADVFVGVCHGVIARICPEARVIDLTHGIARHDVRAGAIVLCEALTFVPVGVHLAVIDPGVGGPRRAVALALGDGHRLVGPDNGLLWPAAQAGGGIVAAVDIGRSPWRLAPVAATFHGRDIFAPVAARLAAGEPLDAAGDRLDPGELVTLELPRARAEPDVLIAHVRQIDRFGNLQLDAGSGELTDAGLRLGARPLLELAGGSVHPVTFARTFADVGSDELLLYEDAQRRLAVAVSHGDAAARLGLEVGAELRIRPA